MSTLFWEKPFVKVLAEAGHVQPAVAQFPRRSGRLKKGGGVK